ncbi:MAG: hypothetical protein WAV20_00160, partial [Blastocatellia bacterium]
LQFNVASSGAEWARGTSSLSHSLMRLLGSSFFAQAPAVTALTLLGFGLFVAVAARDGFRRILSNARELEIVGAALLIGHLFSLSFTIYQPERRFLPVLFLMVIVAGCVLERGWEALGGIAKDGNRLSAVGWFAMLFLLPAIGILEIRWHSLSPAITVALWLLKLVLVAGLVLVAVGLAKRRWPYRHRTILLRGSAVIFFLLFGWFSLALVYKSSTLWGFNRTMSVLVAGTLALGLGSAVLLNRGFRAGRRATALVIGAILLIEACQISTWLFQPTFTFKEANTFLATTVGQEDTVVTYYETAFLSSAARIICRSARKGFNVDAFERFKPGFTMVLRRDNWRDYPLEGMPVEEWPPPRGLVSEELARFELCPTRIAGPRFILELYSLTPRFKRTKARTGQ